MIENKPGNMAKVYPYFRTKLLTSVIYIRICGISINIYMPWDIYFYIYPRKPSKWDIYYIYGTLSWYMQQHTPETETFFRPRIQYTPSTSAFFVLGLRPRTKNASVSGVYCSSDEKMPRFRGYIAAYTPPKHRIYITYIPVLVDQASVLDIPSKCFKLFDEYCCFERVMLLEVEQSNIVPMVRV